jgi:hypothetical protein
VAATAGEGVTAITVLDRYARSYPTLDPAKPWRECDRGRLVDLRDALSADYPSDAHFAAYASPDGRRLNSESLATLADGLEITVGVFDIDCPLTHGTPEPAPESWRREIRARVVAFAVDHPDPLWYETRGGGRIVYRLAERTILRSKDDAVAWARGYHVAVAHLGRHYGIEADPACADWQRLYRLPFATRTEGGRPERWCTWGEWDRIGTLVIDASAEDVERAKARSTVFRAPRARALSAGIGGDGLFFHLLRGRGHVGREHPRGGWIAICPNRAQHSTDTDGSDTTIVVPPKDGGETGLLICKHAHCADRFTVAEWLRMFSESELESARRAAGIMRAA